MEQLSPSGAPAPGGVTRVERVRRWGSNHPVLAPLSVVVAVLAALGGAFGFGRDVYGLLAPGSDAPVEEPVTVAVADLQREDNPRFGFSFGYPLGWARTVDPANSDGNQVEPQDGSGVVLLAFGSHAFDDPAAGDPLAGVADEAAIAEGSVRDAGGEVLESAPFGLHEVTATGGAPARAQIPGWRLLVRRDDGAGGEVTSVQVLTRWGGRNVHMSCTVPSERFPAYRDLCNTLVATLSLDGAWRA